MATSSRTIRRQHRHRRVRSKVVGTLSRPRLAVFRSAKHIAAQVIDDTVGKTLLNVTDKQFTATVKGTKEQTRKVAIAAAVGKLVAEKAKAKKITAVVFDAAGYRYHGRVKALAEGARAGGLTF
jgi:large subunit ribosomal protein L18